MTNTLSQTFDRVASTAVLGFMVASLPLAGVMFIVSSIGV